MSTIEESQPEPRRRWTRRGAANAVAPVLAAALVSGGAVYAVEHHSGSGTASGAGLPAAGVGGFAGGGGGGPVAGEQHIQGTVVATTSSSVTVKSSSGTATYVVDATTEVVRNGRSVSLSAIKAGDPVLVHVYPSSSGRMLVERLLAGSSATDDGPRGFGPPQNGSAT